MTPADAERRPEDAHNDFVLAVLRGNATAPDENEPTADELRAIESGEPAAPREDGHADD